jgi:hypothetical protein
MVTDCIQIVVTFLVLCAAIWAGRTARKSLQLNTFSSLLAEISSEQASKDRGLVRKIHSNEKEHVKELINLVRIDDTSHRADLGRAAERTIARMDRVGFFLLGNGNKLRTETPEWLWTLVKDMWEKLGDWVKYRQTCEKEDPDFYHKNYGLYLQKLEKYRKEHNL